MTGRDVAFVALGAALGLLITLQLRPANTSSCCARVAAGARDRAVDELGGWAGAVGDAFGVWPHVPTLLDQLGVAT